MTDSEERRDGLMEGARIEDEVTQNVPYEAYLRVVSSFLIHDERKLFHVLDSVPSNVYESTPLLREAAEGLRNIFRAASLPFQLTQDAVVFRRSDRMHSAERIRAHARLNRGEKLTDELERLAWNKAQARMREFVVSPEGTDYMRDGITIELHMRLESPAIRAAARELLIQALVSTWSVFENFARAFIIGWINADPQRAKPLLASPDLRPYFGKQVVDIEVIGEHGFDLTGSMGSVLFRGKRLDNLAVIRSALTALFNDPDVRVALGDRLWMLNQRRHLFVHRRGLVDEEYLQRTGDPVPLGDHLPIISGDIEQYLVAVQEALVAISSAARCTDGH